MSRAPACRSQSPSVVYFFSPSLDDMLLVWEAKDHHEEGLAGSREGKMSDGQGERRIGDYLRLPWTVGQLKAVIHPTHMGNVEGVLCCSVSFLWRYSLCLLWFPEETETESWEFASRPLCLDVGKMLNCPAFLMSPIEWHDIVSSNFNIYSALLLSF